MRPGAWLSSFLSSLLFLVSFQAAGAEEGRPVFEVATVRMAPGADPSTGSWSLPGIGRFTATHVSLAKLLQLAYGIDDSQIANKPAWLETSLYDVMGKPESGISLTREELKPRLQALLQERFHLVAHIETRPARGYALVVAKGGPHMVRSKGDHFPGFRINVSPGEMRGVNWSMPILAKYLTGALQFPVVDQTGLAGSYDVSFSYATEADAESADPPLAVALREATGLELKAGKVPVDTLVVTSADPMPTEN